MGTTKVFADPGLQAGGYTWAAMGYYAIDRATAENVILKYFKGKDIEDAMSIVASFYQRTKKKNKQPFPMQKLALPKYKKYLSGSTWNAILTPQDARSQGMIRYAKRRIRAINPHLKE